MGNYDYNYTEGTCKFTYILPETTGSLAKML